MYERLVRGKFSMTSAHLAIQKTNFSKPFLCLFHCATNFSFLKWVITTLSPHSTSLATLAVSLTIQLTNFWIFITSFPLRWRWHHSSVFCCLRFIYYATACARLRHSHLRYCNQRYCIFCILCVSLIVCNKYFFIKSLFTYSA